MAYRYIAADLITGARIAEMPLTGVSYSSVLNGAGSFSAKLALPADDPILAAIFLDATDPARRVLYIDRDGVIVWAGIFWSDDGDNPLGLQGAELWSLMRRRRITADQVFTAADQCTIAENLITYTQAKSGGSIGLVNAGVTSGVARTITYSAADLKQVAEAIEQAAALANGFDFAIDSTWSGTTIVNTFRCSYPHRGRAVADTGLVFEVGRNITGFKWPRNGSDAANSLVVVGAGSGTTALRSAATSAVAITEGYPLLEDTVSLTDQSVQANLDAAATAQLAAKAFPIVLPPVDARADVEPVIGSYITGDEARFRCDRNLDPRFPNGLDVTRRIVGWTVKVPDSGQGETVTLTLDQQVAA